MNFGDLMNSIMNELVWSIGMEHAWIYIIAEKEDQRLVGYPNSMKCFKVRTS